jgi:hypothetical protein
MESDQHARKSFVAYLRQVIFNLMLDLSNGYND